MIRLAIAISHAPFSEERRKWLKYQISMIDRSQLEWFKVVRDGGWHSCWPTVRMAWQELAAFAPDATHHCVLSDDMAPVDRDFVPNLRAALAAAPLRPVNFFSMRQVQLSAKMTGNHWTRDRDGFWGGACVMPAEHTRPFLEFARDHFDPDFPHDDSRLLNYTSRVMDSDVWNTAPSLTQHIGASSSLLGHSNRLKVATWLIKPGEEIDWTVGAANPISGGRTSLSPSTMGAYR